MEKTQICKQSLTKSHKNEKNLEDLERLLSVKKYEEKKVHNMLPLMLDSRLKTLHLVSSLIGGEQGKRIVEE